MAPMKVPGKSASKSGLFGCGFQMHISHNAKQSLAVSIRALAREDKIMADKTCCHMNPLTGFHHMSEATHSSALPDIPRRHQRHLIASSSLSDTQYWTLI